MENQLYKKGRRKEYSICDKLKKEGWDIVQRTAGSNSPIDIIAIDIKTRVIKLIQSKRILTEDMGSVDEKQKEKIEGELRELNNVFRVEFEVL